MADGLLASGLNWVDQQKQALAARLGLLANNPDEFGRQLAAEARQRAGVGLLGEPKTAQEMASGAWINTPYGKQAIEAGSGFAGSIIGKPLSNVFNVIKRDASDIFGAGAEKIRYIDPKSGGTIEILSKPDKSASVLSLEVPEKFRGQKIGESLQAKVLQDFPEMQGQVSSKAAAKTAYRLGRRPVGQPNATLEDVFKAIEQDSSVNLVSPEMQKRFVLDIASQNAEKMLGLPKGNTAMDRAKALGFTESGYTGTNRDITAFDPLKAGASGSGSREGALGTWLTNDPRVASGFADWSARGQGGNVVYPLMIRGKNPKEFGSYAEIKDLVDANTQFARPPYRMMQDTINYENAKKALGDYGVLRNTMTDALDVPITQYVVPDPSRLRSRFAAFDPARVNEPDILAAGVPLGLLAGTNVEMPKKEKRK